MTLLHVLAVAAGGAVGGALRFAVTIGVDDRIGARFPWGTLVVNVSGAGLIGCLAAAAGALGGPLDDPGAWALLGAGVLGSYTTVSSFALDTFSLLRQDERPRAALNVVLSFVLCLGAAGVGYVATDGALERLGSAGHASALEAPGSGPTAAGGSGA